MNCAGEHLALGQHCEAVGECRYVVLWSLIDSFQWSVTLQGKRISFGEERGKERVESISQGIRLTLRGAVGSYLATEYAVVLVSIVLKILDRIPGLDPKSLL